MATVSSSFKFKQVITMGKQKKPSFVVTASLFLGSFVVICAILNSFNLLPQGISNLGAWFGNNFSLFAFLFCFAIGAYVFLKVFTSRNKTTHYQRSDGSE